jgi:hypothetical protein
VANYRAIPIFAAGIDGSDSEEGPVLSLAPFFAQYNDEVEQTDAEIAVEQVALSRASLELEVEKMRRLPPR